MEQSRTKNAARNIFFGMFLKVYQILLPFAMRTAMIYVMGMEYLGLNSLFTSILLVLNLAELGVGSAMVFSMYKPIAEQNETEICKLLSLYRLYYRPCRNTMVIIPPCSSHWFGSYYKRGLFFTFYRCFSWRFIS